MAVQQESWVHEREKKLLASYAMHSADSKGREHPEPEHAYRGPFQRDRDRILHSSAYRRLSGKMQVFTGEMGDCGEDALNECGADAGVVFLTTNLGSPSFKRLRSDSMSFQD